MSESLFKGVVPEEQKSTLPEVLQGKSPEEIYTALQNEYDAQVNKHNEEISQVKADKQKLEDLIKNAPKMSVQSPQQYNAGNQDFFPDPDKTVETLFQERVAPLVNQFSQNMRTMNRENFAKTIGDDNWKKYGEEIDQVVSGFAPQIQQNPESYKVAYNFVMGSHMDDILKDREQKVVETTVKTVLENLGMTNRINEVITENKPQQNLFQRSTGVPVMGNSRTVKLDGLTVKDHGLSNEELLMAKRFGMTPEEYAQYKEQ